MITALTLTTAFVCAGRAVAVAEDSSQVELQTDPPQPPLRGKDRYHPDQLQLRALIYDEQGRWRPKDEVNRAALLEALRAASTIIDDQALWSERATKEAINYGRLLRGDLQSAFTFALALATTKEEERDWLLRKQALTVRLMHFLLETRRRHPDYFRFAWKDRAVLGILASALQTTRSAMNVRGVLRPKEWGMLYGLTWVDQPDSVVIRDGIVFVEATALRLSLAREPVFRPHVPVVLPKPRKARIPVGALSQAGPRQGFRDAEGRVYLPVEEFHRQGELTVTVLLREQMVLIDTFIYRDPATASPEKPSDPAPR